MDKEANMKRGGYLKRKTGLARTPWGRKGRDFFNAKPVAVDGIQFDSMTEARRYGNLKLLQMAGEISGLVCHPKVVLIVGPPEIAWRLDFSYQEGGRTVLEDSKARPATDRELLLYKLFDLFGPGLLRITDATGKTKKTIMGRAGRAESGGQSKIAGDGASEA